MIYFMVPDNSVPSGGIRFAYSLVEQLNSAEFDAAVWHGRRGFECEWFEHDAPLVTKPELDLKVGDVLMIPEWNGPCAAARTSRASVVVLAQNHFNVFHGVDPDVLFGGAYPGIPNAVAAIATSAACRDFVRGVVGDGLPVHLIPYFIDTGMFRPKVKERLISYMPRKRSDELSAVIHALRRRGSLDNWTIRPISGSSERETADVLARSAVFLSGSDREGFGLPPAEAMASGCWVVGYTGDGGREFMLPGLCSVIDDQSLLDFVHGVERVIDVFETERQLFDRLTESSRRHVEDHYSLAHTRSALVGAIASLCEPGSPALQSAEVTVRHYAIDPTWRRLARSCMPHGFVEAIRKKTRLST